MKSVQASTILGIGHYVPSKVVTNHDLAKLMTTSDEWIVQRSGIKERRFIEHSGIGASDLAVPASKMALEHAGLTEKDIDAIIFATLSPDHNFPGSGCFLGHKLGLPGVPALDVRNQCSGFLYGLSIADAWVRAGVYRNILLVGSEVHSTGIELADRGRDVAVLFGDGAGAAIIGPATEPGQGLKSLELHADGSGAKELWLEAPASAYDPRIDEAMLAEGKHYPQMNGKQVFRWATEKMPEVARAVMEQANIGPDQIDLFVPHQANLRINQFVGQKLGIPESKTVANIETYGNTTAATIPLGLSEAWREGRCRRGSNVLFAAFGSGFTWGAAVLTL
ncbi:3-oxoacyl-[acyl-carrier-protein] synthase, KASIII [Labilithrix luteola]|uniref:Beta-ketoacyl-[acyl-carrier-protein] synthase III n=1 Tax=Labilithrix luteola TaxID=1391654 RepID=A0A0K1PYC4_9BACT|nr:beta-ketoacyl-ACP synthase III [Labilithrix luteola]AKU98507.1 3-oxoacyl-[acyl-carrier-protein] synthase, KASIII [Labilithrix luteola]